MNSLGEKLSRLDKQYQDQIWKCNKKYDELVREYRTNHPSKKIKKPFAEALEVGICCLPLTWGISCFTNCDDWWNGGDDFYFYLLHIILPALVIAGIYFLISMCNKLICENKNNRVENSVNDFEHGRKIELNKLQKEYDTDRQQIIVQYNQNRQGYIKQLRDSNNVLKLKEKVFSNFEQVYGVIDKSTHIKEIRFKFIFGLNQEEIIITATQGQNRFHDISYIYERMQMKNLENIEICEALAVVLSEEVDFMIKEHHRQAKTDVQCDGTIVQIEFDEVNMNYKGLEAW